MGCKRESPAPPPAAPAPAPNPEGTAGYVFVTNERSGDLSVIDTGKNEQVASVEVGEPVGVVAFIP